MLVFVGLMTFQASAQYDDLYYDPTDNYTFLNDDDIVYNDDQFDDQYGDDYSERSYDGRSYNYSDDYYYTRRIMRFRRPVYVTGFYDPFYSPFVGYNGVVVNVNVGSRWARPYWNNGWGWNILAGVTLRLRTITGVGTTTEAGIMVGVAIIPS